MFVLTMVAFAGLFVTLGGLAAYAVRNGAGDGVAGVVITALLATTVAVQIFVDRLVRRFGFTPTFVVGLVLLGLPGPFYLLSAQLGWLIGLSILRGAGFGIVAVLCSLMAARLVVPDRLSESIGVYGLAIAAPNLLFTPVGVVLTSNGYFAWTAWISATPVLVIPLVPIILRSMRTVAPDTSRDHSGRQTSAARRAVGPAAILLAVTLAAGGLVSYLPIARPSGVVATVTLFLVGASGALSRWGAGIAARTSGAERVLRLEVSIALLGLIAMGSSLSSRTDWAAAALFGSALVFGIGFGTVQNLTLTLSFARAGEAGATTASAMWNGAFDAGTSVGAFVVGALASSGIGFSWTLVLCAGLVASMLPLTRVSRPESPQNTEQFTTVERR